MRDNVEIQISCENNLTDRLDVACQAFSRLEHAALHGKKKRTRKKNFRRVVRLAEKEAR